MTVIPCLPVIHGDYNNGMLGADPGVARLNVFRLGLQYQLLTPIFKND